MDSYGYFLVRDEQTAKGIKLLKQAAIELPEDKDIQYHLALAYEQSGERQKAQNILKNIVNNNDKFMEKEKAKKLYHSIK